MMTIRDSGGSKSESESESESRPESWPEPMAMSKSKSKSKPKSKYALGSFSVVIPTLNRPSHLQKCLNSIARQTVLPDECVVVDQSDGVETQKVFEQIDLKSCAKKYVRQKQKSLILARNNGLNMASDFDFLCFLDDDLVLFDDFMEKLLTRFSQDHLGHYGGGMGTFAHREKRHNRMAELFLLPHDGDGRFLASGFQTFPHWMKDSCDVEFLSGGITMWRTSVVKKFRYDERLILGYGHGDDIDISYRVSRQFKLFYEPLALCVHDEHSEGRDGGLKHRRQLLQNMYYLLGKNRGAPAKALLAFWWMLLGQAIEDLRHGRKGAFAGTLLAAVNICLRRLDSVSPAISSTETN
jgi:glycosyltransferase involved in cell wall biosynthesis